MSHSSRRGSVQRQHSRTTPRLKQAGRHAFEALESRIAPSTLVTLSAGSLGVLGDAGGGGEDESLVFTVSGGALRISDPAHAIVAGAGTVQDGPHSVLAPLASLTDAVHIFTGGGHDSVAIEGAMPALHAFSVQSDDASSSIAIHGSISVHGADGKGGLIAVTAGRIALEGATLDASGPSGGGAILIGGDLHGGGSLSHAQFVTVDAASVLRADALGAGHGGKVVVWSDQLTAFAGQVSARAGAASGDGGTLEVSGRALLDFRGLGDASAPHGHAGSLLLDPKNITVDSATAPGSPVTTLAFGTQTGQSISLNPSSLTATLNTGTAVTLQASNDLTVTSAITANNPSGAGGALTLQAGRSLLLNASITTDDGALTLVANETAANGVVNADRDPGAAVVTMASGVALNAGAGAVTITMGSGAGLTNSTSGDLTLRDITAGALSVTHQGPTAGTTVSLLGAINTTGASTFTADSVTINTSTGSVSSSAVTLKPLTAARPLDLGTKTAGTLGITNAELGKITAGLVQIGDASSGAMTVSTTVTPVSSLALTTGSTITISHNITMAANKSLTATASGTISVAAALGVYPSITATGTGGISLTSGRNISLVSGAGSPSLTTVDGNLTLSANQQAVPASGNFAGILLTAYTLQTTGSGTLSLLGKGGDGASQQQGILMNAASKVTGGSGLVDIRATGGASSGVSNEGLLIGGNSFITSTGGNVQVTGQGGGTGASQNNTGVEVFAGGLISAGGSGNVTVQGTGGSTTGSTNLGVSIANGFAGGATITSSGGNVRVTGQGGTGGNAYGIYLPTGGLASAGGSGSLTLLGTGGATSSGNYGVYLVGASGANAMVTSSGGPVQITGIGGAGATSFGINKGSFSTIGTAAAGGNISLIADTMSLATDVAIATQAAGAVTLRQNTAGTAIGISGSVAIGTLGFTPAQLAAISTGTVQVGDASSGAITVSAALTPAYHLSLTTGGSLTFNAGITMAANKSLTVNAASTLSVSVGSLSATGTGGISLTSARNISLAGSGSLTTVNGDITLAANQQAVPATGTLVGLSVASYTVQSTGSGAVSLAGKGGDTGSFCDGINVTNGGKVIGGSGLVDVRGTGGAASGNANYGVLITGTGSVVTSTGGNVQVTGQGGGTGAGSTNFGVNLTSGGAISAGGSGSVTVLGTAGNTTGGSNDGVTVGGTISSSGGAVSVTGHGAGTGSGSNYGIYVPSGGSVTAGGAGTVTVSGTGGNASSSFEIGVSVSVGGTIASGGGNVQVTGQGGGTGSSNFGIYLPSGTLSAGGVGSLTIMGTGGGGGGGGLSNYGVYLQGFAGGAALVTSSGGPVQITGVGGAGNFNTGVVKGTFSTITTATSGGNLTVIADTLSLGTDTNTTTQSSGTLSLRPFTAGTKIYLATTAPAGSLGLTAAQFATLATGTLQIGDANSGGMTIGAALSPGFHLTLTTGGSIDFNGSLSMASGKNLTATGGGALTIAGAGVALTAAGTGAISLTSAHNIAVGTGTGISTADGDLTLSANQQTTPASGNFSGILITNAVVQATGAGRVSLAGRGGDTNGNQDGVGFSSGAILRSGSGSLTVRGTGGAGPLGVSRGVYLSNSADRITSGGGDVLVIGQGGGLSVQNYGVSLGLGSTISAGGLGTVTVQGTGGSSSGNENVGVDLLGTGTAISSSGGNVQVTGTGGGTGSSGNNYGVRVEAGAQITSGTAGAVTVFGTGGTTSSGVAVTGNTASNFGTITSGGGPLTITGVAGSAASPGMTLGANGLNFSTITTAAHGGDVTVIADGFSLSSGSTLVTQPAGKVTLKPFTAGTAINLGGADAAGTLGLTATELGVISTGTLQIGDANTGAITVSAALAPASDLFLTTGGGLNVNKSITMAANKSFTAGAAGMIALSNANLTAAGTGTVSLATAQNISLTGAATLSTVDGALSLSANQQAVPATGSFAGISISGYTVRSTGAGAISLAGKGGDGAGTAPSGIQISSGGKVIGGTGPVDLRGTGGFSDLTSRGVFLNGSTVSVSSTGGNVRVIGQGGGTGSSAFDTGVELATGSVISAGGSGTVTVQGTGGNGTVGFNIGVENTGTITSSGGNVSVVGQGTSTSSGGNYGVDVGGLVTAGGGGQVSVSGTGGNSTFSTHEVGISVSSGGLITSGGGNVKLTGQGGGTGTSGADYGVYLQYGSTVSAGGTGSVTILGTGGGGSGGGGGNHGVEIMGASYGGALATSSGGPVQIIGVPGAGGFGYGISLDSYGTISTATSGGDITLIADTIGYAPPDALIATSSIGKVTLHPLTAGTPLYVGDSIPAGSLGFSAFQLAAISTGTLQLGDANSGSITIASALTTSYHTSLTTGAGIAFNAGVTLAVSKNLTATAAGSITFGGAGSIMASGGTVSLNAGASGAILTSDHSVKITADRLSVVAGAGIGSALAPLGFAVTTLETNTAAGNADQYLGGSGTLGAAGLNAGTGTITFFDGTFTLGGSDRIADLSKLKLNNATFALGAFSDTVAGVSLVSGAITGSGGTLTSASAFDLQSGTVSANLAGTIGLSKTTAGTVVLSGSNSYTGATTVAAGILNVQNALALGTTAAGTTVSPGASLQIQGGVSVAEAITVSGTGAAGSTGALESVSGQNALAGLVTLAGATKISIDANAGLALSGGIADTTSGNSGLTLAIAPGGNATLTGGVGGTVPLKSFTSTGAGLLKLGGTLTTVASSTTFGTPVALVADTTIYSAAGIAWQSGATLGGDGAGPWALTLNADTDATGGDGLVTFGGSVGATAPLKTVVFGSNVSGITLAGAQFNTTAAQAFPVAVTLGASESISAAAGDVSFAGTVNGGFALAVHSSGTTSFAKMVGGSAPLLSLSTDASASVSVGVTTIGAQSYGNLTLVTGAAKGTSLTTTNSPVTIGGATTLNNHLSVNSGSGAITFSGAVDGGKTLAANSVGATVFGSPVGAVTPLTSLTTSAGGITTLTGNVTTTGLQTYGDSVTIAAASTLATTNSAVWISGATLLNADLTVSAGTGSITFSGTVNGAHALVANSTGATTFSTPIGGVTPLASLTTDAGGTTSFPVSVKTTGAQTYGDNTATGLGSSPTTLSTTGRAIFFGGTTTLHGDLTVNAGQGAVTFAGALSSPSFRTLRVNSTGATLFGGPVGTTGGAPFGNIVTDMGGTTTLTANVTAFSQFYGDDLIVGNPLQLSANGSILVKGNTTLNGDLEVIRATSTNFSGTVDGAHSFTIGKTAQTGSVTFGGAVGSVIPLTSVYAGSVAVINGGSITTTGDQFFGRPILLGASTSLISTSNGVITVGGFLSPVPPSTSLTITTGATGAVKLFSSSPFQPLSSLDVSGPAPITLNGYFSTTGDQTFAGPVTLGNYTSLNSSSGVVHLPSIDGAYQLSVYTDQGSIDLQGEIGATTPLANLSLSSPSGSIAVNTDLIQTTGGSFLGGATTLKQSLVINNTADDVLFAGLDAAPNGGQSLTVASGSLGTVTFGGAVGSVHPLASLTVTGAATTTLGANVTTSGAQNYAGPVKLTAPVVSLSSDVVQFQRIDGAYPLTVNAQAITLGGEVGAASPLASLSLFSSTSALAINTDLIQTTNGVVFGRGATLGQPLTINDTAGVVSFHALNAATDGGQSLTVSTGPSASVNFLDAVGSVHPLAGLTLKGAAPISLAGDVTTTGAQSYAGAVTLAGSATLTTHDASISFGSTIDGTTPNAQSLVLRAGAGALSFGGAIGATVPLANFTTESGAAALTLPAITLGGNLSVTAGGAISQTGAHMIAGTAFYSGTGIDLSQAGNDFTGVLTLASSTAAPTTVQTANALTLAAASFGGSLSATALHGDLNIAGAIDYIGQLDLTAAGLEKAIIVSADVLNAGTGRATLRATGDIVVRNNAALVTDGSLLALVADSEESHSGAILIEGGSIVENHGGALQLGGVDVKTPAYGSGAVYDGIALNSGISILGDARAGGGYTYLNGQGRIAPAPAGGHNFGVLIDGNGGLTSTGAGTITIFATAGPGSAALAMTNVYGLGTPRLGDDGSETFTGRISVFLQAADALTDPLILKSAVIHSRGALTLRAFDASVGLAGAAGTMQLSTAELAQLADGFSSIEIMADGALTANAVTFTDPVILDGSSIDLQGTVTAGANPVSLDTGTGVITIEQAATFTVKAAGVITDTSIVHIVGGTLDLGAFNETVGGVQLDGGTINAAGGTLTSATNFELLEGAVHASLAGTNEGVGVLKYGDFTVSLSAPGTYGGGTTIRSGTLEFSHPQALGTGVVWLGDADTGSGTVALLATAVMNANDLAGGSQGQFNNTVYGTSYGTGKTIIGTTTFDAGSGAGAGLHDRSTTFAGYLGLDKATTLQGGNSDRTTFRGLITGPSVAVEGGARVVLSNGGDNFFGSGVSVAGAGTTLQLEGNGPLSTTANVDVGQGATLALAATAPVSFHSLSGAGTVRSALAGTPQMLAIADPVGGGNFTGTIMDGASPVSLLKLGDGTQTLSGLNTYTGSTIVKEGKLALVSTSTNNNLASSLDLTVGGGATLDVTGLDHGAVLDTLVLASGQTLHGFGTITGRLQAAAGSTLAPESSFPSRFSTGDLTLTAGSTFTATIDQATANLIGEVNVRGTVSLGDATLHLSGALASSPHQEIVLIQNDGTDPVIGTFHGLPGGAIVQLNGTPYSVSYHGGDGNDVALEQDRAIYAVAAGVTTAGAYGLPVVHVYNAHSGVELFHFTAYETKLRDGIRIAVADMNGDGYDDIITTTATGTGRLRVFDGLTGKRFTSGPFASELAVFDGKTDIGAFVGAGDLTGDGRADIIVGSALGGGKVRVFDGVTGTALTFATGQTFLQPFGKTFKGGIRVAAGDFNGDHVSDLVLGENYYGAKVAVYNGTSLFAPAAPIPSPLLSFDFGPKNLRTGVNLAVGDFDHDGLADLLVGSNAGPTYVQTYSGILKDSANLPQKIGTPIYPFDKSPLQHLYARGVRVASFDVNGDGIADIIAASSGSAKSVVNIYSGADHSLLRTLAPFPALPNSALFIAASATQ